MILLTEKNRGKEVEEWRYYNATYLNRCKNIMLAKKIRDNYDIFIIGGGINGAGIARDASGRGLKVCLAEKGKVGSATSSWSSKLIHGGLRYLENYEFKLVAESLREREVITQIAPNITKPLPCIIPHSKKLRYKLLKRLGLFL